MFVQGAFHTTSPLRRDGPAQPSFVWMVVHMLPYVIVRTGASHMRRQTGIPRLSANPKALSVTEVVLAALFPRRLNTL